MKNLKSEIKLTKDEISASVRMDKNLIILECMYHLNNVKVSIIKDNTYYSIDYPCILDALNGVSKLNKDWPLIIDSNNGDYNQMISHFNKIKLNFKTSRPTPDQVKKMGINNLTLIGLYIYTRRLIKIR